MKCLKLQTKKYNLNHRLNLILSDIRTFIKEKLYKKLTTINLTIIKHLY